MVHHGKVFGWFAVVIATASLAATAAEDPAGRRDLEFFESRIRPVLVRHCYSCHSAEAARAGKLKGGLQLDTRAGMRQGGDSGPAIVPGKAEESLLLEALTAEATATPMPPQGKLPDAVIADFERWISAGAADPREGTPVVRRPAIDPESVRRHWAFQPIRRPAVPDLADSAWPRSEVDRFVLAGLRQHGLAPVADADDRALARRLHFDLIGLPPTPDQLDAFLDAAGRDRQGAVAELVEGLLASSHFGERWGRHWLDAVRFAESNGRDFNVVWPHAWRYRDWVIRAWNEDKPYDRFLREQVAGDLLPAGSPRERDDQVVATGVLAMGSKLLGETKRDLFRMNLIDEQIELIGRTVLGLSISCARCHDHKFDPIPTRDYYALAGIFGSTEPLYGLAAATHPTPHAELQAIGPEAERLGPAARDHLRRFVDQHRKLSKARSDRYRVVRRVASLRLSLGRPDADRAQIQKEIDANEREVAEWDVTCKKAEAELEHVIDHPPPQPDWAMAARDRPRPEDCRIHIRGETTNLGDLVPRGVLQVIPVAGLPAIAPGESGRRQLADWLASRHNPLTPRVTVNRIWMHLIGRGLVATVDDFGKAGTPPSHPELLDWLTSRFLDEGWSVKTLIRSIVLSRTYQLSRGDDPQGRLTDPDDIYLWRMRPRRLEVEAFRDAVMAVSGELDLTPPDRPFLAKWDPFRHQQLLSFRPFVVPEQIDHAQRSVYLPVLRGSLPELYGLFDFADPNRVVAQRDESTLPAQSLFLLNSPWMIDRARHTVARLREDPKLDDAARLDRLYTLALSRLPTADERARALAYLDEPELLSAASSPSPSPKTTDDDLRLERWASYCQVIFASAEFSALP